MNSDNFLDYSRLIKIKKKISSPDKGTAVITGGCGRIGSIFTGLFLSHNLKVIILSKTNKKFITYFSKLPKEIKKNISWKKLDLTNAGSIENIAKSLKNKRIEYLINNAAFSNRGEFFKYDSKKINEEMWGTFNGTMLLTERILLNMRKNNKGKIIFTGSLWGLKAPKSKIYGELDIGPSAIIASGKAGILQYAKFLAARESTSNITVNTLLPGWFPRKGKIERKLYIKNIKKNIPLNRIGKLEDLITAVEFLIASGSEYVTGEKIIVDGGYSIY